MFQTAGLQYKKFLAFPWILTVTWPMDTVSTHSLHFKHFMSALHVSNGQLLLFHCFVNELLFSFISFKHKVTNKVVWYIEIFVASWCFLLCFFFCFQYICCYFSYIHTFEIKRSINQSSKADGSVACRTNFSCSNLK